MGKKFVRKPIFQKLFSGHDGVLYAVNQNEHYLFWFQYKANETDSPWAEYSSSLIDPKFCTETILDGETTRYGFLFFMSPSKGIILTVDQSGNMSSCKHQREAWEDIVDRELIGSAGWETFDAVLAGTNNNIFAITKNGNMLWYKFILNGDKVEWIEAGAKIIVKETGRYQRFFADKSNRIFAVDKEGGLHFFEFAENDPNWPLHKPNEVGSNGWESYAEIVAGERGEIYAMTKIGTLFYYKLNDDGKTFEIAQKQIDDGKFSREEIEYD